MAQTFYPADDEVGFDAHSKRDALSMSHTLQSDSQQDIVDRNLSCINMGSEIEAKTRGATRRRIPVACMRCRKRKIKCSGDVGDGQGCSNCRSAGNIQCQFLRVNSSILQTKVHVPAGPGWPYPASDMASRIYVPSATPSKMGGFPINHPNHRVSSSSRVSDYGVTPDVQSPYGRQPFGIEPTINYDDESSGPYNVQTSSAYILPSSPQVFMADYCQLGWNSKNWAAVLPGSRAPTETMFSENDADNSLNHTAYSYMNAGQGQTNGASSLGITQGSLASPAQGTERTLPNPTSRSTLSGSNSGPITTTDGLPSVHTYKSGHRWASKCESRTPIPPGLNMPFNSGTVDRAKLIPANGNDMSFGFLPVAPGSATSPLSPSSGSFAGLEVAPCTTEAGDEFRENADSRYRAFSRDNRRLVSHADYRPDTYGYSRPAYRNRSEADDPSSESTLINGLPYTRSTHSVSLPQTDEKSVLHTIAAHPTYTSLCSQ
ncbi:hypothetical protein BDW60DRAFT_71072 [Aspergillus nidulans var. acristatus]